MSIFLNIDAAAISQMTDLRDNDSGERFALRLGSTFSRFGDMGRRKLEKGTSVCKCRSSFLLYP